ncbi:MAG: hypothetical protein E7443_01110 [Ruminococcaceae bacterium]|nr:hypothetical protein [Oscillospiraceae bacterium]
MQPALLQGVEIGMHIIPLHPESPLCWIFWVCCLLGGGIWFMLSRSGQRKRKRWIFIGVQIYALLCCEIACQVVTGWDLLIPVVLYFYLLAILLGAGICALGIFLLQKKRS